MNRCDCEVERGSCLNCRSHVSTAFARTFGDDGRVHRCQSCDSCTRIQDDIAVGLDIDGARSSRTCPPACPREVQQNVDELESMIERQHAEQPAGETFS